MSNLIVEQNWTFMVSPRHGNVMRADASGLNEAQRAAIVKQLKSSGVLSVAIIPSQTHGRDFVQVKQQDFENFERAMQDIKPSSDDPQSVIREVFKKEGIVDPVTARRFLNTAFYEVNFVNPETGKKGLLALPLEIKLNLYESIASEGHPNNVKYLAALNAELGLTSDFNRRQRNKVRSYFEDALTHRDKIQESWTKAGNDGRFADIMGRLADEPGSLSDRETKQVVTFLIQSYARHCGIEPPKVIFYEAKANQNGYRNQTEIGINTKSIGFKTLDIVCTAFHEMDHEVQIKLGAAYRAGKIGPKHSDYKEARVFAANLLAKGGYISPNNPLGHDAYALQPAEVAAQSSGKLAVRLVNLLYGKGGDDNWKILPSDRPATRSLDQLLGIMPPNGLSVPHAKSRPNKLARRPRLAPKGPFVHG